jgi:hypothetical protein
VFEVISELKLLKGSPIYVGDIVVYPLTIEEITDELGEDQYFKLLSVITIDKERVGLLEDNITNFDLVCAFCLQDPQFQDESFNKLYFEALKSFLHHEIKIIYMQGNMYFAIEEENVCHLINNQNYNQIIEVIKYQNCMIKPNGEEDQDNPADDKAKELLEKRKKARELLAKAKKGEEGEPLTLADLVSILVANGNGVTPFNVWDMNFYMFNNQFNRMRMLEEYDINIRSLLAGAKSEDIDLKHWMSKIK